MNKQAGGGDIRRRVAAKLCHVSIDWQLSVFATAQSSARTRSVAVIPLACTKAIAPRMRSRGKHKYARKHVDTHIRFVREIFNRNETLYSL